MRKQIIIATILILYLALAWYLLHPEKAGYPAECLGTISLLDECKEAYEHTQHQN